MDATANYEEQVVDESMQAEQHTDHDSRYNQLEISLASAMLDLQFVKGKNPSTA